MFQKYYLFICIEFTGNQELSDVRLLNLSTLITDKVQWRILAIKGLRIEDHLFSQHFVKNPLDINTAAYDLLQKWRTTQPDVTVAYTKMCDALTNTNKEYLINKALL